MVAQGSCHAMQEIDYKLEGQNADRFRKNFADSPWIKVTPVTDSLCCLHLMLGLPHHTSE